MRSFKSGGKEITIHHFAPELPDGALAPAVLVVHGSGGGGTYFEYYGRELTRVGYHVFVVHYFERTGHSYAHPQIVEQHFLAWMQTLADSVTFALEQPGVDPRRVALLGVSLGGYLSLALASQDPRITAVVDIFGGMPKPLLPFVKRMPPVLILHGDKDAVVPVEEAHELERLLQRLGADHRKEIYSGQGHGFSGIYQLRAAGAILGFLSDVFRRKAA
jgi:carboxymethylenebutenolidase